MQELFFGKEKVSLLERCPRVFERGSTAYTVVLIDSEPAMRIGAEFQVAIPDMSEFHSTTDPDSMSQGSGSILVWTPNPNLKTEYCKRNREGEERELWKHTPENEDTSTHCFSNACFFY